MADTCAYCQKRLGFFSGTTLLCANTEEYFCSECYDKLYDFDRFARARAVLEHGLPASPGSIRVQLEQHDAEEAEKQSATLSSLTCSRCAVPMVCLGRKKFQMGEHSFWGGDHSHLIEGSLEVELQVCPQCHKLEYFLPADSELLPAAPEETHAPAVPAPPSTPSRDKTLPWEK